MEDEIKPQSLETERFNGTVRLLRETDLPQLKPILETWIRHMETGELLSDEVNGVLQSMRDSAVDESSRVYLVAEELDGRIIGAFGIKPPEEIMKSFASTANPVELAHAYIDSSVRGRGVGRQIIGNLEELSRSKGFTEIILNSGPRYKESGWPFYDKLDGFSRVGIAKDFYGKGVDAPVWHKVL